MTSDILSEIDRADGIIPATPQAVGALVNEIRRLRNCADISRDALKFARTDIEAMVKLSEHMLEQPALGLRQTLSKIDSALSSPSADTKGEG